MRAAPAFVAVALFGHAGPVSAAKQSKKSAYGAIAYEPARRATGYSYDFKTAPEAKVEALKQCGEPACEVLVSFRNACGAVARGRSKPITARGAARGARWRPRRSSRWLAAARACSPPARTFSSTAFLRFRRRSRSRCAP